MEGNGETLIATHVPEIPPPCSSELGLTDSLQFSPQHLVVMLSRCWSSQISVSWLKSSGGSNACQAMSNEHCPQMHLQEPETKQNYNKPNLWNGRKRGEKVLMISQITFSISNMKYEF